MCFFSNLYCIQWKTETHISSTLLLFLTKFLISSSNWWYNMTSECSNLDSSRCWRFLFLWPSSEYMFVCLLVENPAWTSCTENNSHLTDTRSYHYSLSSSSWHAQSSWSIQIVCCSMTNDIHASHTYIHTTKFIEHQYCKERIGGAGAGWLGSESWLEKCDLRWRLNVERLSIEQTLQVENSRLMEKKHKGNVRQSD